MADNYYVGTIENFKRLIPNIQRASLFDVTIPAFKYYTSSNGDNSSELKFSVKTATFPEASVGDITVPYMGRKVHFYGSREYGGTWATTVILDGQWKIYDNIYAWNQAMNGANRIISEHMNSHFNFKVDAYLTAYTTDGRVAKKVNIHGLWPKECASLSMNWDSDGAVDWTVTWVYDYVTTLAGSPADKINMDGEGTLTQFEGQSNTVGVGTSISTLPGADSN